MPKNYVLLLRVDFTTRIWWYMWHMYMWHMWQRICGSLYLAAHKLLRDKGHVGVAVSAQAGFELDMVQYFKVSIQPIQ